MFDTIALLVNTPEVFADVAKKMRVDCLMSENILLSEMQYNSFSKPPLAQHFAKVCSKQKKTCYFLKKYLPIFFLFLVKIPNYLPT